MEAHFLAQYWKPERSLTPWGTTLVHFTLAQGADEPYFLQAPHPEKQHPGASSMAHTCLSAEFLLSPVEEGVEAAARDRGIWERTFLRENSIPCMS